MAPCLVCPPDRAREPRRGLVCEACRGRLPIQLAEIPDLTIELGVRELVVDTAPNRGGPDPVADNLPAGGTTSRQGPRISGTRERPAPLSLTTVDLLGGPRYAVVHDRYGDQIGEASVSTVLDLWVQELREHRRRQEQLPRRVTPAVLAHWLVLRLDDAFEDFTAIGDFAAEVRRLRAVLRTQLGLVGYDDQLKEGVVCPKCDARASLYQTVGSDHVECRMCPSLLTVDEFNGWTRLLVAQIDWLRGQVCEVCSNRRVYRVRGTDTIRCGWCEIAD